MYKFIVLLLGVVGAVIVSYYMQQVKKGTGSDPSITYKLQPDWPNLPKNLELGNPTGIGVDTNGNVVVFHRAGRTWPLLGPMPGEPIQAPAILVIDRASGNLLRSWGSRLFLMPHGLTVDRENNIWVTDVGLHQVFKFNAEGKRLLALGVAKEPGGDSSHFNKPTDVAVAKDGSIYVADGYGNSRVVKFSAAGRYQLEWGRRGAGAGEFNIPHGIVLDEKGNVYVADRENNRIQVFTGNGEFLKELSQNSFGAICGVAFDKTGANLFAVDDVTFLKVKHRGSDIFVFDGTGKVVSRFGRSGAYPGAVAWYHDVAVDGDGTIYVGDILRNSIQQFRKVAPH